MPNSAAYKKADIEDARRGHPAVDLAAYEAARGLEPLGQALVGHVAGLNPRWKDYVFNAARGEIVPGRFGTIQHEAHEVGLGDDCEPNEPGRYFGQRAKTRMTWRSFIPLGELFEKEAPDEPWAAQSLWLPTTAVKVMVPEASLLPPIRIVRKDFGVLLDPVIVPGWRLDKNKTIGDDLQAALAQALGPALAALRQATVYADVKIRNGALGLRVDGYRDDPDELDALIAWTGQMAEAVAQLAEITHDHPAPAFADPLPAFDSSTHPAGYFSFDGKFDNSGMAVLERDAGAFGLRIEDPAALHRAYARLPIPGTSRGILAGTLPGTDGVFGRLTWNTQRHPGSSSYLRRGAIVAARPGATPTPVGGTLVDEVNMYVAVVDGLACAWTKENTLGKFQTAELAERAVAALRATGAAEL